MSVPLCPICDQPMRSFIGGFWGCEQYIAHSRKAEAEGLL